MPVIPRVSGATVGFQPAMLSGTSGDAYAAPGRAMQGLGQAIGGLGAAFEARGNEDDEFRANLELTKFKTQQDINAIKSQYYFNGDPRDFAAGQVQSYDAAAADLRTRLPNNPKILQKAALHLEQWRGSHNENATRFEYGKLKEQLVADIDGSIAQEANLLALKKPEQLTDADILTFADGNNFKIDRASIPEVAKSQRRELVSKMVLSQIARLPGGTQTETARKLMDTLQSRVPPPGPQSDAGGMTGGSAMAVAKTFLGKHEGQDAEALSSFFKKSAGQNLDPSDTAWCAAFVNAALGASGQKGTGTLLARDFLKFGAETKEPTDGDIVVLSRGDRNGWQGHVGFYAGKSANGNIRVLGGNQGNKVSVQEYAADRVLGYRKPPKSGSDLPGLSLPQSAGVDDAVMPAIKTTLSAYSPQVGGSKMEGGYAASKPGPDGKAEVRTLEDVASGRSPYVTVAGNPSLAGKSYTIPEITFIGADGKEQTLKNVKAVVHDTGSAFKSAPEGRFDVPIGKDADDALMAKNAGIWLKAGVQFVPEGNGAPVRVAGLKTGTMTDAGQQGQGSIADDLTPRETDGSPEANARETARIEAAKARVAGGGAPTFAPQAGRTTSVGLGKASVFTHVLEDLSKHMHTYEAADRRALEAKIKTIEDRAAKGEIPPPAEVQQMRAMTKDHPQLSTVLETTLQGAEFTRAYMQSNPVAVDAKIQQLRGEMNTKGTSQALSVHVAALEKLQTKMDSELKKDPFGWGAEAGVLPVVKPIAPQSILTAQGADLLAERVKISDDLVKHYGEGYRQYFTPTEKTALVAGLKQGGPAAIGILTQMRTGMGERMPDAVRELLPDEPEMARAGFLAAYGGDPKGVEAITATFARKQDGKSYKAPAFKYNAESRQTDAKAILGDVHETQPDARELDRTMRAAEAIYEHLNPDGSETDGSKWKQAVKMAIGVRVDGFGVEYGGTVPTKAGTLWGNSGGNVAVPSNIAANQFQRLRADITKEHLVAAGLPLPATKEGNPIPMGKIATSQLVQAGYGKYYVVTKGTTPADYQYAASIGPDGKPTGKPFVLDMMALEPVLRKQFSTDYFPTK